MDSINWLGNAMVFAFHTTAICPAIEDHGCSLFLVRALYAASLEAFSAALFVLENVTC